MFKPGKPKTGGRKPGTPNKKTQELLEVLQAHDFNPGEELIWCYTQAQRIASLRLRKGNLAGALLAIEKAGHIAGDLAQYVFPRKKAIEHSGEVGVRTFADFIAAGAKAKEQQGK